MEIRIVQIEYYMILKRVNIIIIIKKNYFGKFYLKSPKKQF